MAQNAALTICLSIIAYLLWRDCKNHPELSHGLWLPQVWFFLLGSKSISGWFNLGAVNGLTSAIESYQEGNPVDRNILLLMMFIGVLILRKRNLNWSQILRENALLSFFALYCLISMAWSDYPFITFRRFIKFAGMILMVLVVLSERSPTESFLAIMRRSSYAFMLLCYLFIRYYGDIGRYYDSEYMEYTISYCGITGNKNEFGIICIIGASIFLWELLNKLKDKQKTFTSVETWIFLLLFILTVYLLRMANSSTSTMCVIIACVILLVTLLPFLRNHPHNIGTWFIVTAVVLVSLQSMFDIKGAIITALGRKPNLTERLPLWNLLLSMGTNPIFGAGYESFWTKDRISFVWAHRFFGIQAHNGYIETYLTLGMAGVLFMVAFIVLCYRKITKEMVYSFDFNRLRLALIVVFCFYNYTEAAFPRPGVLMFFFFLIIMKTPIPVMLMEPAQNALGEEEFPVVEKGNEAKLYSV